MTPALHCSVSAWEALRFTPIASSRVQAVWALRKGSLFLSPSDQGIGSRASGWQFSLLPSGAAALHPAPQAPPPPSPHPAMPASGTGACCRRRPLTLQLPSVACLPCPPCWLWFFCLLCCVHRTELPRAHSPACLCLAPVFSAPPGASKGVPGRKGVESRLFSGG